MLRRRFLAAATATFLALGMAVGGASPAIAGNPNSETSNSGTPCKDESGFVGADIYNIPEDVAVEGLLSFDWGEASWTAQQLIVTVDAGWTLDICVKGGKPVEQGGQGNSIFYDVTGTTVTIDRDQEISHFAFANAEKEPTDVTPGATPEGETCDLNDGTIKFDEDDGIDYYTYDNDDGTSGQAAPGETVENLPPGDYSIDVVLLDGFELAEGVTTPFTVTVAAFDGECDLPELGLAQAQISFIAPECDLSETLGLDESFFLENAELVSVDVDPESGEFTVVFGLDDEGDAFDTNQTDFVVGDYVKTVTPKYSEDNSRLTLEGVLDGPDTGLCPQVIIPDPMFVDTCDEQSYTIAAAENLGYVRIVDGLELPVEFGEGEESVTYTGAAFQNVVIRVIPDEGFVLPEGYEDFEYTFGFELCLPTAPTTTASVSWVLPDCIGNPGSYRLTNEPGVIWTVDGVVVAGNTTYTAAVGSTPTIEASLEGASEEFPTGFGWNDPGQQTLWNLAFPAAADNCLPTLALTGASNALGGLGIVAVVIMMAGTGLVLARRREVARAQG